ncbi:MAG TPA: phosphatase PAP2 family protein [Chitinophagales bacterium]|nr:phosphatase PAP2 family protein [Chitinophagales bacterium]
MKHFLVQNKIFFLLYAAFLVVGAVLIATMERGNEILFFNSLHNPLSDSFFKYITRLAEFPLLLLGLVMAVRFSYGKGLILSINMLLVFGLTTFLKHVVFEQQIRPSIFFEGKVTLNFIEGLEILKYNSFPSGHTAGAFGMFCMLSILLHNKKWSYLFFTLALLVGISRVYLLQHFFRDVYAGSLVGVVVSSVFYLTFVRTGWYGNLAWKDKALLKK